MVATMRSLQVGIATGKAKTDPSKLNNEQWALIIKHAVSRLTIDYLHGLKTLEQALRPEDQEVQRYWDPPRLRIHGGGEKGLVCYTPRELPSKWDRVPGAPGEYPVYAAAQEEFVFLERTRDGVRYLLVSSKWAYHPTLQETWLEGLEASVNEISLESLLEDYGQDFAEKLMFKLLSAQEATTTRLEHRVNVSRERAFELTHMIGALGHPIW